MAWRLPFEEGTLLAVGYRDRSEVMRREVKTAGEPAAIVLTPDRSEIKADGSDLSFITVTVVDSENVPVPHADDLITFTVEGAATIAGVDNGCQTSMEPFRADYRRAFNGRCLLVVKAGKEEGSVRVAAVAEGMTPAVTELTVR